MEKLTTERAEALNTLLAEQTPEQCIITMRTAMNAFINKVCKEITTTWPGWRRSTTP